MPITIRSDDSDRREVAWLADDQWEMPKQMAELEVWLEQNLHQLPAGKYYADLGFSPRPGAAGGGCAITGEMMKMMLAMNIELHLSEYPEFD